MTPELQAKIDNEKGSLWSKLPDLETMNIVNETIENVARLVADYCTAQMVGTKHESGFCNITEDVNGRNKRISEEQQTRERLLEEFK